MDGHEMKIAIPTWPDKNDARIDRGLSNAWPAPLRKQDLVDQINLQEVAKTPRADFLNNYLSPTIKSWT